MRLASRRTFLAYILADRCRPELKIRPDVSDPGLRLKDSELRQGLPVCSSWLFV
jgi:hypothetical protein